MLSIAPIDVRLSDIFSNNHCKEDKPVIVYDPLQVLSGKITPEPSIEFSNYDVLLVPCEANEPICCAPGNHVGNQRFRVLLSLFRQRYLQADARFDVEECTRIARELMDTVCQKCVPNGRFYEKDRTNQWQELELGPSTISIVQRCLKNELTDSVHDEERSSKRICRRSSAFGSVVSTDSIECAVTSPNTFDVICDADELQLKEDCQHTGNNRVKVLLDVHTRNYKKSDPAGKRKIAQKIVCSIIDDASSQFLQMDELGRIYNPMPRELAFACIKNSLDTSTEGEKRHFRESEVKKLMARKKKKAVLGRFERRKGIKCYLPNSASTPTTFTSFH